MEETFPVTLPSGRKVAFRELTWLQQNNADMCVPEAASSGSNLAYRVAMAITEIDGAPVTFVSSKIELEARMQQFRGTEGDDLINAYYGHVRGRIKELPKESAPENLPPDSSQKSETPAG